jgi:hypothetical protein
MDHAKVTRTNLELIAWNEVDWQTLDRFTDRTIAHTRPWLEFIRESQQAEPVLAAVKRDNEIVGYFTGLLIRKYGMKILGSPFPGWTTSYMGFNMSADGDRLDALKALPEFAFKTLGAIHLEIMDRHITVANAKAAGFAHRVFSGFEIDLRQSEDDLFAAMSSACRRCIRKAEKSGVIIEEAHDEGFAEEFHRQLIEVFDKQSLPPTYPLSRVKLLVKHLLPAGHLLLLRANNRDGVCVATGVFPAYNDTMYFWGGASHREYQIDRPNEALQWYAMRFWKARGISKYDMGGGGEYKRKYGGMEIEVPWIRHSRSGLIRMLRLQAERLFRFRQRLRGGQE